MNHKLFVSAEPEEAGWVWAYPSSEDIEDGVLVYLEPRPREGWEFSHWLINMPERQRLETKELLFHMHYDRAASAHFVENDAWRRSLRKIRELAGRDRALVRYG